MSHEPRLGIDTDERPADDGGAVGRFLTGIFGRSYRTTIVGGLVMGGALLDLGLRVQGGGLSVTAAIPDIVAILTGAGLMVAKDGRVSGRPR